MMPTTPTNLDELLELLAVAVPVYLPIRSLPKALVCQALDSGVVSEWSDSPAGRAILLSSLECERRDLVLTDDDVDKARWIRRGAERSIPPLAPVVEVPDGPGDAPGPLDLLIERETALEELARPPSVKPGDPAGAVAAILGPRTPRLPLVLLGSTRPDWRPAVDRVDSRPAASPCAVCGGRKLAAIEACLACLRSGVDHLLPKVPEHERPRAKPELASKTPRAPKAAKTAAKNAKRGKHAEVPSR